MSIEIDKKIAELRGNTCTHYKECYGHIEDRCHLCKDMFYKPYSTDIKYAFELWDEMKEAGYTVELEYHTMPSFDCCAAVYKPSEYSTKGEYLAEGHGETEAEAICRLSFVFSYQ